MDKFETSGAALAAFAIRRPVTIFNVVFFNVGIWHNFESVVAS